MNIKQQLINKTRAIFVEPVIINISEKQYHSDCIFYKNKKHLNIKKSFVTANKNRLDEIILEIFDTIQKAENNIIYMTFLEKEGDYNATN